MKRRGHLLLEAMVAGAVFLTAIGGLAGGLIAASKQIGVASFDQQALMITRGAIEALEGQPINGPGWAVGTVGPTPVAGYANFTVTTTVTSVVEATGPVSISYRQARVTVNYASGRSVFLEARRW